MNTSDCILITGSSGLIGSALHRILIQNGFKFILSPTHLELDLTRQYQVEQYFDLHKPKYVFHLAAKVGGIHANTNYPADFIYANTIMQANIFEAAYKFKVKKLLVPGSACTYPKYATQPIDENQLGCGSIEITNIAYGSAKLNGVVMARSYYLQYGLKCIVPMPTNAFGINDNFDPNYSHVIPALMLRMHEARLKKSNEITLWGTGSPLREFIYADDLARAFIFLMNKYEQYDEHINIGTMEEISIKDLALMVANVVGYQGNIRFDTSKPDGAIRKILNSKRLFELGWKPVTTLQDGLTIMYQHHFANN